MKQAVLSIILITGINTSALAGDCFPDKSVSNSPTKQHSITWQEPRRYEANQLIFVSGKEKKRFFEFTRAACVCWEPSGEHFAITNHMGSNTSEAYVYSSHGPDKVYDILDLLPLGIKKMYAGNFHHFMEVTEWTAAGFLVHVWGYEKAGSKGFDVNLKCVRKDTGLSCGRKKG